MQFDPGEINVICTNEEASLVCYRDVLGFADEVDIEGYHHLHCGSQTYLLLPIASLAVQTAPYGSVAQFSVDLMVDDLEMAYKRLLEAGAEFAQSYQPGARMMVVRDPDGLPIEIIQRRK